MDLIDFIHASQSKPFAWGKHDCLTFANRCAQIQAGHGFADEWMGAYRTAVGAARLYLKGKREHSDLGDIVGLADARMEREMTLHPRFGMIVAKRMDKVAPFGLSFGVVLDQMRGAFVGPAGLVSLLHDHDDMYWSAK